MKALLIALLLLTGVCFADEPIQFSIPEIETPDINYAVVERCSITIQLCNNTDGEIINISDKKVALTRNNYVQAMEAGASVLNQATGSNVTGQQIIDALTQVIAQLAQ